MVLISIESKNETEVVRALSRRHEITRLYTVSGRYDLCAMLATESTQELDAVIDKIRVIKGVVRCPNPGCITNTNEPVESTFEVLDKGLHCLYCDWLIKDDIANHII